MKNYILKWNTFVYQKIPQREWEDMSHTERTSAKHISSKELVSEIHCKKKNTSYKSNRKLGKRHSNFTEKNLAKVMNNQCIERELWTSNRCEKMCWIPLSEKYIIRQYWYTILNLSHWQKIICPGKGSASKVIGKW